MTCIEKHLLQQYIDHECTEDQREMVKQHLSDCPCCKQKQMEMEMLSFQIKDAIHSLGIANQQIPVFKNTRIRSFSRNVKLIIYSLSAACVLLFVLFLVDKKLDASPKQMIIVQSIASEVDANRPASDQEFDIEVYDGKGQRSEYLIE